MTEIDLHFLFAHYGLYGNAPVGEDAVVLPLIDDVVEHDDTYVAYLPQKT